MSTDLQVYLIPNKFDQIKYGTQGILENNQVTQKVTTGKFQVPTDWSVWLVFNPGFLAGRVKVKSWVQYFSEADIPLI